MKTVNRESLFIHGHYGMVRIRKAGFTFQGLRCHKKALFRRMVRLYTIAY